MKRFNYKKRILLILLSMILAFSNVGCSNKSNNTTKEVKATTESSQVENQRNSIDKEVLKNYKYGDWISFNEDGTFKKDDRGATGKNGVISSQRYEASKIGTSIMEKGGNAIDAAVATAFALGVCEPNASGLGGGGFAIIREGKTGEIKFIDFREVAPSAASEDMFPIDKDGKVIDESKIHGGKAVAVPGEVKGLLYILEKYGTMDRKDVMQPAIELAENGFLVTPKAEVAFADAYKLMKDYPEFGKIYTKDNLPVERNNIVKNPDLANTLKIIAEKGEDGFYKGEVAESIVNSVKKYDGIITLEDLANYNIHEMEPVAGTYHGYKILSSPTPSSGGTHLIQILNILENYDMTKYKLYDSNYMHLLSETFKMVYADRAKYMGDPNYVKVPIKGLMSKEYAKKLASKIDMNECKNWDADDPWKYEGDDTSHISSADKDGNMIGITKSINYYFGSGVVPEGRGFILNNHMDDFSPVPGEPNSVQPNKKPLSSMSPTIILREDNSPYMVLGAPGGSSIFAQLSQVISHVIDNKMDLQDAINLPRILDNIDNKVQYMEDVNQEELDKLKALGHEITKEEGAFGFVQAVEYLEDGTINGGADPYSDAKAVGY
ncbi:gamma-glutamyltransferase [Peptoniphilus porci]|uniref:Glutathione hydrolase proenzyme n=1 Tax=Peptoniphilus porci TaxID=2652280 RepID=A0A1U7M0L1_9FIRM|nr:gamma-glutamyltransferase [Peptoniphilus porci]OLR65205.1 gamma-glutamyltransferase [Peptoniphilus porci]